MLVNDPVVLSYEHFVLFLKSVYMSYFEPIHMYFNVKLLDSSIDNREGIFEIQYNINKL